MTEPHTLVDMLEGWGAYYTPPPAWGTDEWINEFTVRTNNRYLDDHNEPQINNNKGEK